MLHETPIGFAAAIIEVLGCRRELIPAGLGMTGIFRGVLPFPFMPPLVETWLLAVATVRRLMQQKPGQLAACHRRRGQRLVHQPLASPQIGDDRAGCRFRYPAVRMPSGKTGDCFRQRPEPGGGKWSGGCPRGSFAPKELGCPGDQADHLIRITCKQLGEQVLAFRRGDVGNPPEAFAVTGPSETNGQPLLQEILIGERRGGRVDDGGARIKVGLNRVGLQQLLAEAVNGCAGDFIKRVCRRTDRGRLFRGQSIWQRQRQLPGDRAAAELGNETLDPFKKLCCRRLREGDGDNVPWTNAVRQHQRDAAGHQGGLAASGAGFDQEGR